MNRYRIYTEDTQRELIRELIESKFNAYTLYLTHGAWYRTREYGLVIELVYKEPLKKQVQELARLIKVATNQEEVLVTTEKIKGELI